MKAIILLSLLLTSCSLMPSHKEMQKDIVGYKLPQNPKKGKSLVYVIRPGSIGCIVKFDVYVDGQDDKDKVGHTYCNQYIYFDLEPGKHKIWSEAENWIDADLKAMPNMTYFYYQEAQMGILYARNNITQTDDVMGKYFIKRATKGTLE